MADHHKLLASLDQVKSALAHGLFKTTQANLGFNPAAVAADDPTTIDGFGREYLVQPEFGVGEAYGVHPANLAPHG